MLHYQFLGGDLFHAANISGVMIIFFLVPFSTGKTYLVGIGNDYEIPIVNEGGEGRLMFATQSVCDFCCQTAKDFTFGIYMVPFSFDLVDRSKIGFHVLLVSSRDGTNNKKRFDHCRTF